MDPINLGRKGYSCPEPVSPDKDSVHYPTLYIDDVAADLPDEGEITLKYKVTSRNTSERDGKKSSSICLECRKIVDVEGEDIAANEDKETEATLDRYAEEESKKS